MSKAATYNAIAQGLGALGSQMQYNMQQDALQRRQESLLALRRQFQVQDQQAAQERQDAMVADERKYQAKQGEKAYQRERGLMEEQYKLGEPEREANLAATRARTGLLEAQANLAGARSSMGGPDGNGEMTALEKEIPLRFRQDSLEVASTQAPMYFSGGFDDSQSVDVLLTDHPQVAKALGITPQTPLNEAMGKVEEALYRDRIERYSSDFAGSARSGLMGGGQSSTQGNTQEPPDWAREGQTVLGPDGQVYVIRNGQPVLEQ